MYIQSCKARSDAINQNQITMIKLKQDYYGNQDYGKRAFWILDAEGNYSFDFVFIEDLDEWVEWKRSQGKSIEIEYADGNLRIYNN